MKTEFEQENLFEEATNPTNPTNPTNLNLKKGDFAAKLLEVPDPSRQEPAPGSLFAATVQIVLSPSFFPSFFSKKQFSPGVHSLCLLKISQVIDISMTLKYPQGKF